MVLSRSASSSIFHKRRSVSSTSFYTATTIFENNISQGDNVSALRATSPAQTRNSSKSNSTSTSSSTSRSKSTSTSPSRTSSKSSATSASTSTSTKGKYEPISSEVDSDTLQLLNPEDLVAFLSTPLASSTSSDIKHVEIHFDLCYYRNKLLFKTMWSNGKYDVRLRGLESVKLTTSGFNFYVEDHKPVDQFDNKTLAVRTLTTAIDRILDLLVDQQGPKRFIWVSTNGFLKETYNRLRQNGKYPYPQMPRTIPRWTRTISFHLPFLMRPTWSNYHPFSENKNENDETINPSPSFCGTKICSIQHISIPGEGMHKWLKGEAMSSLIKDLLHRHDQGEAKVSIEIRGQIKKGRERYIDMLQEALRQKDKNSEIELVWID
ncbi:uncharacterized protein IL334_006483 [Kwoniella shivajii]|uniref:Uncharacterized protein n=1 Tax=Kwoniella shivajii TaxID=564305 RepID=A0ABZ1D7A4_9TREE|nr:hypothetical protein IL334_006483 [Kwoniella shivajii]